MAAVSGQFVGSATRSDWLGASSLAAKRAEIRGWRNIGYHGLIDFDGQRAAGRPETGIGAHVVDHNRGTIGICLIDGHGANADDQFGEHFTSAQARTLRALIADIRGRTQITKVTGQNDYTAKACTGFRVAGWI